MDFSCAKGSMPWSRAAAASSSERSTKLP
jgi:hypothetical protein